MTSDSSSSIRDKCELLELNMPPDGSGQKELSESSMPQDGGSQDSISEVTSLLQRDRISRKELISNFLKLLFRLITSKD